MTRAELFEVAEAMTDEVVGCRVAALVASDSEDRFEHHRSY